MNNKILVALGAAAMMAVAAQSASATEKRESHKITRHHVSTGVQSDARVRNAYDEWRPAVPAAAFDEAARYRGTTPTPAGH